ncbi:MAG TPA: winged helix-turn-helix domain-containing protein [Burkholderiaceae bacterium]|nr:winged helix-turn-helix domain-containing protein [Burkholderiaceae bacterium]
MRYFFGDCSLDPTTRELRRGEAPVHVEPQVFDLLLYLLRNRDHVVGKDELLAAIWGKRIVSESTLASRINAARQVIGDDGEQQRFIRTVARRGVRFVGDVRDEADAGGAKDARAPPAAALPDFRGKPTVAVLPFHNLSGKPEQDYFSDAISEDIITVLSRYRTLVVIARNSAFAFRARETELRHIGLDLGADYVVDGSVRRLGKRLRILAHLIETERGSLIWAEQYDCSVEELFDLQDQIAMTIAARMMPGIDTAESLRAQRKPPETWHVWDLFHLGMRRFYRFTGADNLDAQRLFREALARDPDFAQAYASLSYAIVLGMVYFDAEPEEARLAEATALARKGVEIDTQDAQVRFAYGRALLARRAYEDALAQLEVALELNPALPVVHCALGDSLACAERFDEALPYFEKAIALSPFDPHRWAFHAYGAFAHLLARRFEPAAVWAHRATRVPNCHYWAFAHRVAALGHLKRSDELQTAIAELKQLKPDFTCGFAHRRLFYVREPAHLDAYVAGLRQAGLLE